MKFQEMLEKLHVNQYAAREVWTTEYVCIMPGMGYMWKILTQPNPNAGNYLPLLEDLLADDWKIITTLKDLEKPEAAF